MTGFIPVIRILEKFFKQKQEPVVLFMREVHKQHNNYSILYLKFLVSLYNVDIGVIQR